MAAERGTMKCPKQLLLELMVVAHPNALLKA
jgi:hypothetical protein